MRLQQSKKKKSDSEFITCSEIEHWHKLLDEIENKDKIPINFLDHIIVNLANGKKLPVPIKTIMENEENPAEAINKGLRTSDLDIRSVDVGLDVERVCNEVNEAKEGILSYLF